MFERQTWLKDRSTGARNARKGDPASIVRQDVPDLRIVPEELWLKVRARYEETVKDILIGVGAPETSAQRQADLRLLRRSDNPQWI
ncbi:hypothetical protein [Brevundimonas sp. RM1]